MSAAEDQLEGIVGLGRTLAATERRRIMRPFSRNVDAAIAEVERVGGKSNAANMTRASRSHSSPTSTVTLRDLRRPLW